MISFLLEVRQTLNEG